MRDGRQPTVQVLPLERLRLEVAGEEIAKLGYFLTSRAIFLFATIIGRSLVHDSSNFAPSRLNFAREGSFSFRNVR